MDRLQRGGIIPLLGRGRKLKKGSAKQKAASYSIVLEAFGEAAWSPMWGKLDRKGYPVPGAGYKARAGKGEIRARGDETK